MSAEAVARRYFDNAATTFPKPPGVADAVRDYMEHCGASAGRGAYREAVESGRVIDQCRTAIRRLFNARSADHVIFTLNGSDGLNMAIKGVVRPGQHVVTTAMDHNSVLRPLAALQQRDGVSYDVLPVDPQTTLLSIDDLAAAIRPETALVAINHASNVTGVLQPLADIADLCRQRGVPLLVDAAQSAGHLPIDFADLGIDLLATPGHKGLLGPLGTGILLIRGGFEQQMQTLREGGTGSESEKDTQPDTMPDRFESGSHNAAGLAGLLVSVNWLNKQGLDTIRQHEEALCEQMIAGLDARPNLTWFGPRDVAHRVGVFCVRAAGYEPQELSAILEMQYGVLSRSGLHCAPFAHRAIKTDRNGGATRLSLGPFLTPADVTVATEALKQIAATAVPTT